MFRPQSVIGSSAANEMVHGCWNKAAYWIDREAVCERVQLEAVYDPHQDPDRYREKG